MSLEPNHCLILIVESYCMDMDSLMRTPKYNGWNERTFNNNNNKIRQANKSLPFFRNSNHQKRNHLFELLTQLKFVFHKNGSNCCSNVAYLSKRRCTRTNTLTEDKINQTYKSRGMNNKTTHHKTEVIWENIVQFKLLKWMCVCVCV